MSHRNIHSFPTRRSSDLRSATVGASLLKRLAASPESNMPDWREEIRTRLAGDRKSTRLNSSHLVNSYAVFCLKKKKQIRNSIDIADLDENDKFNIETGIE